MITLLYGHFHTPHPLILTKGFLCKVFIVLICVMLTWSWW